MPKSKKQTDSEDTKQVTWLPPPVAFGEKLLEAVEYKPLEEKYLYGFHIPINVLKNLSTSEIRDLVDVFQTFDRTKAGYLYPDELYYAMRALGFNVTIENCENHIQNETHDLNIK
jgi:hypothetical protein